MSASDRRHHRIPAREGKAENPDGCLIAFHSSLAEVGQAFAEAKVTA
jgi:hypothetical protein